MEEIIKDIKNIQNSLNILIDKLENNNGKTTIADWVREMYSEKKIDTRTANSLMQHTQYKKYIEDVVEGYGMYKVRNMGKRSYVIFDKLVKEQFSDIKHIYYFYPPD